jgi:hypothetical protein
MQDPNRDLTARSGLEVCERRVLGTQSHPDQLAELAGILEPSVFLPLRRFEMDPVPIGTWPIATTELDIDTGLGLLITVDRSFDLQTIEAAWPGATAALAVLRNAGFSPDAVRLAHIMGLDILEPVAILLAAKWHPHARGVALWLKVDIDRVPIVSTEMTYA